MKKIYCIVLLSFVGVTAFSQLSVGIAGNYTMYKGDFGKSTPGAHIRAGYSLNERMTINLGFNYHLPIKQNSSVYVMDDLGDGIDVASEINYKFKTILFMANYKFIGNDETAASFYGQFGAGLVLVTYDEKMKGAYDQNTYKYPQDQLEKTNENGFTINLGLGADYQIGLPIIFGEAAIALPANKVNDQYVTNVIPTHFVFNVGVRIPIGGNSDY